MHRNLRISLVFILASPVHFSGVLSVFAIPVHLSGALAAAIHLLIYLRAPALKPTHHRPYTLWQRLQHLNHQMHVVPHNI